MRFRGVTEEGETIEFQNYCKDSDYIMEYGSELGVHKGIWKYIKKDTLVCLEVQALERQLAEVRGLIAEVKADLISIQDTTLDPFTYLKLGDCIKKLKE